MPGVLVVGSPQDTELNDALFACGLTPVFRETILSAIAALRRERFLAVVIDRRSPGVDPLEIILNIRDVDKRVRIFVLEEAGGKPDGDLFGEFVSAVDLRELVRKLTPTAVPMPAASDERAAADGSNAEVRL